MAKAILPTPEVCVLYLRMSDERQEHSIPAQRQELLKYAEKHGYQVLGEYLDEAISGDDTGRRVGFLRMREDAQQGEFSVVLCWDQDRFGRFDPIEGGYWILPFRNAGVRLETIAQGRIDWNDFAGRLLYLIQQEGKHAYLRDLSRNVARGQLNAAIEGRGGTGGRAPVGYRHEGHEVVVDQNRAEIVRLIFSEYLKPDASIRYVVEMLNTKSIRTARGNKWSVTTVRDTLTNRKYTGAFVRFRYRVGKYHGIKDGEIIPRQKNDGREEPEPMVVEDHHEPIIDKRTFERVQRKLAGHQKRTAHRTGHQYIFSGLLRCGDCGGSMGGVPARNQRHKKDYFIYNCRTFHNRGRSACHPNSMSEQRLLGVVVRKLQAEIFTETAIDRLLIAYRKRLAAQRKAAPTDEGRLRKQIEILDRQIDQGAERVLSAPEKLVATMYAKLDRLRAERERLQTQLNATGHKGRGSSPTDDKKVEEAARVLRDLRGAFQDAEPKEIRGLIEPLVSKIELHFDHVQEGKRRRNPFNHGTIFVRPTDPALSLLFGNSGSTS